MNWLEVTSEGIVIPVKAHAGARKNGVTGIHGDALKISVSQAPEKGKANEAIVDVLAKFLQVRAAQIQIRTGMRDRRKSFLIQGVSLADVQNRIQSLIGDKLSTNE